ncbi:DUF1552 domain-containing protein [Pirellulaceae bacterium]|nr:DUF1552 domain-containing protein [Pirellulaceae bacterium]
MRRNSYLIPRRTMLTGAGMSVALPLLDIMSPAISHAKPTAQPSPRLCVLYKGCGVNPHAWDIVGGTETDFELSKILQPLAGVQEDILVVGNLDNEGSSDHLDAPTTFMSGARRNRVNRYSFDQRIADQIGSDTPIKSMQLTADNVWKQHPWLNILSYDKNDQPMRGQYDPQAVFNAMYKDETRDVQQKELLSVLDGIQEASSALARRGSIRDQQVLEQYYESIRDVEKSIHRARQNSRDVQLDKTAEIYDPNIEMGNLGDRIKAMLDLITLAFWTDSTRIISCMLANTNSRVHYDFMGVNAEFHHVSHHVRNRQVLPAYDKINIWHAGQLRYLIDKMKSIKESEGTLFDNSLILWGSGIKHGDYHSLTDLPLILTGGAGGRLELGRHVRYPQAQPYANLLLTMMKIMGANAKSIGDSTGQLSGITEKANFKPTNPDDGSWRLVNSEGDTLTAKGLLRISIESDNEYYQLRFSDKSDLEIRIPYMNNHKLRFDRCVGKVVTVTGQYKMVEGKKTIINLTKAELESR